MRLYLCKWNKHKELVSLWYVLYLRTVSFSHGHTWTWCESNSQEVNMDPKLFYHRCLKNILRILKGLVFCLLSTHSLFFQKQNQPENLSLPQSQSRESWDGGGVCPHLGSEHMTLMTLAWPEPCTRSTPISSRLIQAGLIRVTPRTSERGVNRGWLSPDTEHLPYTPPSYCHSEKAELNAGEKLSTGNSFWALNIVVTEARIIPGLYSQQNFPFLLALISAGILIIRKDHKWYAVLCFSFSPSLTILN